MKYARLTKEQLEELHPEFINFLATQSIDKKEWDEIKKNKPQVAMQEIDVFSDLIWERALTNVNFIDHFSTNYIFLFKRIDTISQDRNQALFKIIKEGGIISKGELYSKLEHLINN